MPTPRPVHDSALTINIDIGEILRTPFLTGIQRVVRELTAGLLARPGLRVRLLSWDAAAGVFRIVAADELLARFADPDAPVVPTGTVRIDELGSDHVLLELDAVWNSPLPRERLYAALDAQGATIIVLVYDLIPVKFPELCPVVGWAEYLDAVVAHADLALTISHSTEADLHEHLRRTGVERPLPTIVLTLGSEVPATRDLEPEELAFVQRIAGERFLFFVGTIEPRKHQLEALLAFQLLADEFPDLQLVFVGRTGWNVAQTVGAIIHHPEFTRRVHWLRGPSDRLVDHLYSTAFATVYLTSYEGWGLPVAESLGLGTITITSLTSSLPEVGGTTADYVHPRSPSALAALLRGYLADPQLADARRAEIAAGYSRPRWIGTADRLARILAQLPLSLTALSAPSGRHPRIAATRPAVAGFDELFDELALRHDLGEQLGRFDLDGGRRLYLSAPRLVLTGTDTEYPISVGWRLVGEQTSAPVELELRGGAAPVTLPLPSGATSGELPLPLPPRDAGVDELELAVRAGGQDAVPDAVVAIVRIAASDVASAGELFAATRLAEGTRPIARRVRDPFDPLRPVRRALKPIVERAWPSGHHRIVLWRSERQRRRRERWLAARGLRVDELG